VWFISFSLLLVWSDHKQGQTLYRKIRMGISEVTSSQSKYESCRAHSISTQDGIQKEKVKTHSSLQLFGNEERITIENRKPISEWLCNSYTSDITLREVSSLCGVQSWKQSCQSVSQTISCQSNSQLSITWLHRQEFLYLSQSVR